MVTLVENGEVKNRHFHRVEWYDRNGTVFVIEGKALPDHIRLETDFRRVHGNVLKLVEKRRKSRRWTTSDTVIAISLLHLTLWILSRI